MEKKLREALANGKFENVSVEHSRRMSAIRGRGNKSTELNLRLMLVRAGVRGWCMHPRTVPGKPDFYFPHERLAIFVDGCFWHGCPECGHVPRTNSAYWQVKIERNRQRDERTVAQLAESHILAIRLWEHELRSSRGAIVQQLRSTLSQRAT